MSDNRFIDMQEIADKAILDVTCGGRMMWFNKQHPSVLYVDKRVEPKGLIDMQPGFSIEPDMVCDFRNLPFPDKSFRLVLFDPPHVVASDKSILASKFGSLDRDTWREDIKQGFEESWRVLMDYGVLIFKWSEVKASVRDVLELAPTQPLFGHTTAKSGKTKWMTFMKFPNE